MNAPATIQAPPTKDLVAAFKAQVANTQPEFRAALPAHIPVERFMRIVTTAVTGNIDLLQADRRSLFESAMKAAQDGLLPDGREGALVIYNTKIKEGGREVWIKKVQWMPMIAGILKKVRNSGELASIVARVVYEGDKFRNWIDDQGEHLEYEAGDDSNQDVVRRVFAMAKLKDGSIEVEVLSPRDVEKIRNVSKAKDKGPWVDWWDEMAKKSALRRLAKRLPISTDLDDLVRRDDALYDFEGAKDEARALPRGDIGSRLDALAATPRHGTTAAPAAIESSGEIPPHNPEIGEIIADETPAVEHSAGPVPAAEESREPGEAAVVDPVASPPGEDLAAVLLEGARAAATNGTFALNKHLNKLPEQSRKLIDSHVADLKATAKEADKAGGQ